MSAPLKLCPHCGAKEPIEKDTGVWWCWWCTRVIDKPREPLCKAEDTPASAPTDDEKSTARPESFVDTFRRLYGGGRK